MEYCYQKRRTGTRPNCCSHHPAATEPVVRHLTPVPQERHHWQLQPPRLGEGEWQVETNWVKGQVREFQVHPSPGWPNQCLHVHLRQENVLRTLNKSTIIIQNVDGWKFPYLLFCYFWPYLLSIAESFEINGHYFQQQYHVIVRVYSFNLVLV